ncbi:hypothetical protein C8R46DRAFT_1207113 [Mycena filopes]|nr:hypothetical protein C8R46DRAFT_1207113 [Mycena filopes]
MPVGLATIPLDTQLEILAWIPDFPTLHSSLLLNRSFSQLFTAHRTLLTKSVAQNHFGELLDDALILANTQKDRHFSDTKNHAYKSHFISRLLSNEDVMNTVELVVFPLIREKSRSTPTKLLNLKRAAYRFWTFCMGEPAKRRWFLSQFSTPELSEMTKIYDGVHSLVMNMHVGVEMESDHDYDRVSSIISTGLGRVCWLWELFQEMTEDPESDAAMMFDESLAVSGDGGEEGFFRYDMYDIGEEME